jgi:hypothetical protein
MTDKRQAANRRNALKSTGPKTPEGKARTSMNALKHGLRAASLAVPILENAEDWEAHRSLVVRDLAPAGYLETILSERVAALLWRLGRVVRYESAVVSIAINEAGHYGRKIGDLREVLPPSEDPESAKERAETLARVRILKPTSHVDGADAGTVLSLMSEALELGEDATADTPEGHNGEHWGDWDGWTRETLEEAVLSLKAQASAEYATADPWELAVKEAEVNALAAREAKKDRDAEFDEKRHAALLPKDEVLEKVSRYEGALERSLFRTLHELQRLRAARAGEPLLPPAAVDVDLAV